MAYKKVFTIGAILVAVVAVLGLASVSLAATGQAGSINPHNIKKLVKWQEKAEQRDAKFTAVQTALANNDYQAWLEAVGADSDQAKVITAEKFPQLVSAYKLEQEGRAKMDEARKIRQDLGLNPEPGRRHGPLPPTASQDSAESSEN